MSTKMTFIIWNLIHLCFEYNVDTPTLFPGRREKKRKIIFIGNFYWKQGKDVYIVFKA